MLPPEKRKGSEHYKEIQVYWGIPKEAWCVRRWRLRWRSATVTWDLSSVSTRACVRLLLEKANQNVNSLSVTIALKVTQCRGRDRSQCCLPINRLQGLIRCCGSKDDEIYACSHFPSNVPVQFEGWLATQTSSETLLLKQAQKATNKSSGTFSEYSAANVHPLFRAYYMPMCVCKLLRSFTQSRTKRIRFACCTSPSHSALHSHEGKCYPYKLPILSQHSMPWFETTCIPFSNDTHLHPTFYQLALNVWCFYKSLFFTHYLTLMYVDDRM